MSGYITFDRVSGEGVFSIDQLLVCDQESDDDTIQQIFQFQTETSLTSGTGERLVNSVGHPVESGISGESGMDDGECYSIIMQTNFNADTGRTSEQRGNPVPLAGDEDNNVIVFMNHHEGSFSGLPNDGATIVAYISGVAPGDIQATETVPTD